MHDVLRQRVIRHLESLPEEQIYQVLDYIEFLESKYARSMQVEASALQRFAEGLEDRMRRKAMSPHTLREAFQLIAAADRVLSSVSTAGREILGELGARAEPAEDARQVPTSSPATRASTPRSGGGAGEGSGEPRTHASTPARERRRGSSGGSGESAP
jgi:hypothetical protein